MNSRAVVATAIVAAIHAALLVAILTARLTPPSRPVEVQTITAELLPPPQVATPVAVQSPEPPKPVPVEHTKPKIQPRPVPKPTPMPVAPAPSQQVAAPQPDPTPAPVAPPVPAAPVPAPARPTIAMSAPKNVSHLDCNIVKPDYPLLSKRRGETGVAYVAFVVGLTGKLQGIELKKSSGYSRLDDAALEAMRASSCKPYLENGEPVLAAHTQPFDFSLTD